MARPNVLGFQRLVEGTNNITVPAGTQAVLATVVWWDGTNNVTGMTASSFVDSAWTSNLTITNAVVGVPDNSGVARTQAKVTATGAQTVTVSTSGATQEGATGYIVYLDTINADDYLAQRATSTPGFNTNPSVSVSTDATEGFLVVVESNMGNSSIPSNVAGWTSLDSYQQDFGNMRLRVKNPASNPETVNGSGDTGQYLALTAWSLKAIAGPTVTLQPQGTTVLAGAVASFTSTATGTGTVTGQWQSNNGGGWTDIVGQTSDTYNRTTVLGDNGLLIRRNFTDDNGTTASDAATLTVVAQTFVFGTGPRPTTMLGNGPMAAGAFGEFGRGTAVAAGGSVTGDLAATESGSDTFAASGTVSSPAITGSLSATESGSDTFAASGGVRVAGSLSATESGADTAAIAGVVLVQGSLSATEAGSDTAVIIGGQVVTGSLSATETGSDTAAISGAVVVQGALSASEAGADTAAITGAVLVSGSLNATEVGSDTAAISGSQNINGSLNASESGSDTFAASGSVVVQGLLSASESGSDSLVAAGSVRVSGSLNAVEQGGDTAEIIGVEQQPEAPRNGGFVMTSEPSKLWWLRKPKALDDKEADAKVKRVVREIKRVVGKQVERNVTLPTKQARAEVREQIAPILADMPGFDWGTVYRALLIQAAQERQALIAEQMAQEAIRRMQDDEDDVLILLMG